MNYKIHRKELIKEKAVAEEYEKLLPEYELIRSIIEQRLKKNESERYCSKGRCSTVYDYKD